MNAGAYGREFKDVLVSADALDRGGRLHTLSARRDGSLLSPFDARPDWIFVGARFKGARGDRPRSQRE